MKNILDRMSTLFLCCLLGIVYLVYGQRLCELICKLCISNTKTRLDLDSI